MSTCLPEFLGSDVSGSFQTPLTPIQLATSSSGRQGNGLAQAGGSLTPTDPRVNSQSATPRGDVERPHSEYIAVAPRRGSLGSHQDSVVTTPNAKGMRMSNNNAIHPALLPPSPLNAVGAGKKQLNADYTAYLDSAAAAGNTNANSSNAASIQSNHNNGRTTIASGNGQHRHNSVPPPGAAVAENKAASEGSDEGWALTDTLFTKMAASRRSSLLTNANPYKTSTMTKLRNRWKRTARTVRRKPRLLFFPLLAVRVSSQILLLLDLYFIRTCTNHGPSFLPRFVNTHAHTQAMLCAGAALAIVIVFAKAYEDDLMSRSSLAAEDAIHDIQNTLIGAALPLSALGLWVRGSPLSLFHQSPSFRTTHPI